MPHTNRTDVLSEETRAEKKRKHNDKERHMQMCF